MKKTLLVAIAATSLFACGSKKKPADSSGSATSPTSATTTGSGAATDAAGTPSALGAAAAGSGPWTDKPDPLHQAVIDASFDKFFAGKKNDPSLFAQMVDAAVAAHAAASRDPWDPGAVFATIGKDRVALFKWVRDNTALVPYRGSLRGAVGVMMDRVGNSLDRSLLLANLLEKAGLEVRLANAQLTPDLVAKLVAAGKTRPRPALSTAHLDDAALVATLTKIVGADATAVNATIAKQQAAAVAVFARSKERTDTQAKALAALVPASGTPAATDGAYTDHWWVQVHDGDAWTDLDPSLPTAAPGEALASVATDTFAPADIDDDRRHTLALRVIGEVWHGSTREEKVLVDTAFAPLQFYGQNIVVTNVPLDMPNNKEFAAAPDGLEFTKKALIAQKNVAPIIRIGASSVVHFSVNDRGELTDVANGYDTEFGLGRTVQHATQDGVGNATGMLDQMPGPDGPGSGSAPAPTPTGPAFTAEWLEVEIRTPGAAPKVVRRTVFDSIGPVADRNAARPPVLTDAMRVDRMLALTGEIELLPLFAQIPGAFIVDRDLQTLVGLRDILPTVVAKKSIEGSEDKLGRVPPAPSTLYTLALGRFSDPMIYLDSIDVLALRHRIVAGDKSFALRTESDIVANAVAVWPSSPDPRLARIAQGIRDTDLETFAAPCIGAGPCLRGPSTSELFAANGKEWTVNAAPTGYAAGDHSAGYTVVSHGSSPQTWWRIDAATGETLGMNPLGGSVFMETLKAKFYEQIYYGVGAFAYCLIRHAGGGGVVLATCAAGATVAMVLGALFATAATSTAVPAAWSSSFSQNGLGMLNGFGGALLGDALSPSDAPSIRPAH
ncbi:MAG TPA: hypothetical protein VGM90_19625 [Kofleriaceae bacterium]|jgi:hypothetical protein